jgi:ATP-dependent Clp protease, protease subunit
MSEVLPQNPEEAYCVFCSVIDQASVQRILNAVAIATQKQVKHIHLLFQSTGGIVADGICLYNFLRTAPIDITLYNMGSVQSIATLAYLGAKHRKVHSSGTFMLHKTTFNPNPPTAPSLQAAAKYVSMEDERTELVLKDKIELSSENWNELRNNPLWFTAADAIKSKIAEEIGEFSPPKGAQIYNL